MLWKGIIEIWISNVLWKRAHSPVLANFLMFHAQLNKEYESLGDWPQTLLYPYEYIEFCNASLYFFFSLELEQKLLYTFRCDIPVVFSFIHSVFCLTTGPKPPLKQFLHIVRSRASSFKWEYPRLSLRSSSSFLRLLPRLLVTSMHLFIFYILNKNNKVQIQGFYSSVTRRRVTG